MWRNAEKWKNLYGLGIRRGKVYKKNWNNFFDQFSYLGVETVFKAVFLSASFLIKVASIMYLFNFFLVNLMTFSDFKIAGLKQ